MALTLIMGAQWGDEGKGKIVDYLSKNADLVIRYHGGNNAGHTVVNKYGKFPMHLIPSGIFNPKITAIIANGVVVDLEILLAEIKNLEKAGIKLKGRLFISPRCHLIMPYHKILDKLYEKAKGKYKTGTTGRGIGPVYSDKVSYNGIRFYDLLNKKLFAKKLKIQLFVKNAILKSLGEKPLSEKLVNNSFFKFRKKILPFVQEVYPIIKWALKNKKNIILEGAHGVFLDNDLGTYPFVTASACLSGGITGGSGIAPNKIDKIIGVVKAYTTRVGAGPFPTELFGKDGGDLREKGGEFGSTTGRPRRCGWFDAELIRFASEVNGFNKIVITKLDVLDSFTKIKVCTHYLLGKKKVTYIDGDTIFLSKVKPVYKIFKGWQRSIKGIKKYQDLPKEAKAYLAGIEKLVGTKIAYVSTGPKANEIIKL